jgi:succinate-semialdehyde dehydrogenase/glutarate-semialdehyde dehydrogenase
VTLYSINPATELEIGRFDEDSPSQIEAKIAAAAEAFRSWRRTTFSERAASMRRAAAYIRNNRERLSRTLVDEMGKPIVQARREVDRFAGRCDYFAEHAEAMLSPEHVPISGLDSWIRFEPMGVALGIMPWNFPFGQASRWAVPALMAGNTALLKHASNVTLSALAIQEVFDSAGFPPGVFTPLFVAGDRVAPIIADTRIAAVSLTGSAKAGEQVGAAAGHALKKVVLELGGSDPFIVLADADVPAAAEAAVRGRFLNNSGQQCTAAKRFIVVESVADAFIECFIEATRKLRTGDPTDEATDVGPLARSDVLADLMSQQEATVAAGARVAYRADLDERTGHFFPPTVLTGVTPEMAAARDETFGPLAAVMTAADAETAVEMANQSPYGLGCSIWSADIDLATRLAGDVEAGMVAINSLVVADPRLPFGGVKRSGYGREMSVHGLRELTNIKAVNVGSADAPRFSR